MNLLSLAPQEDDDNYNIYQLSTLIQEMQLVVLH